MVHKYLKIILDLLETKRPSMGGILFNWKLTENVEFG